MNWQPIETAPKDGTEVWAFNGEQARMVWLEDEFCALWVWGDALLTEVDPSPDQPTHWMPLPAAPGEKCRTCSGHGAVGNILTAEPCPDCTPAAAAAESFEDRMSDWAHGDALDAARYRWLRDNATRSGVNIDIGAGVEISETLDAAVDDAMRLTAAKESP